jgi:two-component system chemotaxis response regulator CheB
VDFQTLRSVLREKIMHVTRDRLPLRDAATMPPAAGWMDPATHDAVVIGASTGGPRAIETVLTGLGRGFDLPIVMAQHMPEGFTRAFAQRLDRLVGLRVREAEPDALLTRGTAWLAPAGRHLAIAPGAAGPVLQVVQPQPHALYQPSVDVLFASAAAVFSARVIAVLLTGMGDDGAAGMETLFRAGAHTIAQDEASSVVFGMPRAAIARGAARDVLALDQIAPRLELLAGAPSAPALGAGVTP